MISRKELDKELATKEYQRGKISQRLSMPLCLSGNWRLRYSRIKESNSLCILNKKISFILISSSNCLEIVQKNQVRCSQCIWGFQTEETIKTAETLLGDLSGFSKFRKDAQELLDELRQWRQEQFDDWTRDITDRISDPKEPLWSVKVDRGTDYNLMLWNSI